MAASTAQRLEFMRWRKAVGGVGRCRSGLAGRSRTSARRGPFGQAWRRNPAFRRSPRRLVGSLTGAASEQSPDQPALPPPEPYSSTGSSFGRLLVVGVGRPSGPRPAGGRPIGRLALRPSAVGRRRLGGSGGRGLRISRLGLPSAVGRGRRTRSGGGGFPGSRLLVRGPSTLGRARRRSRRRAAPLGGYGLLLLGDVGPRPETSGGKRGKADDRRAHAVETADPL